MPDTILIEPPMDAFLKLIRHRVVVVGSVARGKTNAKDLDLLWDMDSEPAYKEIKDAIAALKMKFISVFIRTWTFQDYGWQVEILSTHRGPFYRAVRRRATKMHIPSLGFQMLVARPQDAPP